MAAQARPQKNQQRNPIIVKDDGNEKNQEVPTMAAQTAEKITQASPEMVKAGEELRELGAALLLGNQEERAKALMKISEIEASWPSLITPQLRRLWHEQDGERQSLELEQARAKFASKLTDYTLAQEGRVAGMYTIIISNDGVVNTGATAITAPKATPTSTGTHNVIIEDPKGLQQAHKNLRAAMSVLFGEEIAKNTTNRRAYILEQFASAQWQGWRLIG